MSLNNNCLGSTSGCADKTQSELIPDPKITLIVILKLMS